MIEDRQQLGLRLAPNGDALADEFAQRQRERWGEGDGAQRMSRLARLFPCLDEADGIEPWNPEGLIRWACGPMSTLGDLHAVRFVLQVWNPSNDWQLVASSVLEQGGRARAEVRELALAFAPFNVASALGVWDDSHRAAFMDWVEAPFFPSDP